MSDAALISGESSDSPFLYPEEMWPAIEARFWAKVEKTSYCWNWRSSEGGYAQFSIGHKVHRPAHRVSCHMAFGPVPAGMYIDHTCHNKACVRPEHLRPLSNKQNGENRAGAPVNSSSGILGVYLVKATGMWRAQVRHLGRAISLGSFADKHEAGRVAAAKRIELFTHNDLDRAVA